IFDKLSKIYFWRCSGLADGVISPDWCCRGLPGVTRYRGRRRTGRKVFYLNQRLAIGLGLESKLRRDVMEVLYEFECVAAARCCETSSGIRFRPQNEWVKSFLILKMANTFTNYSIVV